MAWQPTAQTLSGGPEISVNFVPPGASLGNQSSSNGVLPQVQEMFSFLDGPFESIGKLGAIFVQFGGFRNCSVCWIGPD